jgi:D-alanine-D-alanine ligase-like ATP-grasp enzyme
MKVEPTVFDQIARFLARSLPEGSLRLETLEIFSGPTPNAAVPTLQFQVATDPGFHHSNIVGRLAASFPKIFPAEPDSNVLVGAEALAALTARMAARLLDQRWALGLQWGAAPSGDGALGWFEYLVEPVGYQALTAALLAVGTALGDEGDPAAASRSQRTSLEHGLDHAGPDLSSQLLIGAARRRDVPAMMITRNPTMWQFGWGKHSERFWFTASNGDGMVGNRIALDKEVSKRVFRQLGIPTPRSQIIRPGEDHRAAANSVGWPCVVKPATPGKGAGVTIAIDDAATLDRAVGLARKHGNILSIEAHHPGDDHRLLVIDGTLVAAVRKRIATVVGDGKRSLDQLLAALNRQRSGPPRASGFLRPIQDDDALAAVFSRQEVTKATIPEPGRKVRVATTGSWWRGGTGTDVFEKVHPQVRLLAEQIAGVLKLRVAAIDYVTRDIGASIDETEGMFLEAHTVPAIELFLSAGVDEQHIADRLLGPKPARIPVTLLIAPDELHEKLTNELRQRLPETAGLATPEAMQIGSFSVPESRLPPHARVTGALRYATIERLIVLWRPEDVVTYGLPVDALDSAIVLGPPLPDEWAMAVDRHAREVRSCADPDEAVEVSLGTAASA